MDEYNKMLNKHTAKMVGNLDQLESSLLEEMKSGLDGVNPANDKVMNFFRDMMYAKYDDKEEQNLKTLASLFGAYGCGKILERAIADKQQEGKNEPEETDH